LNLISARVTQREDFCNKEWRLYCISEKFPKTKDVLKMAKRRKRPTQKQLGEQSQEGQEEVDFSDTSQAH
jgi:hypothetical protein